MFDGFWFGYDGGIEVWALVCNEAHTSWCKSARLSSEEGKLGRYEERLGVVLVD